MREYSSVCVQFRFFIDKLFVMLRSFIIIHKDISPKQNEQRPDYIGCYTTEKYELVNAEKEKE